MTVSMWWHDLLLDRLAIPVTQEIRTALSLWAASVTIPAWTNNPLACGQDARGAHQVSPLGVRSYPDSNTGINATATAIRNPRNKNILSALKSGGHYEDLYTAICNSDWPWTDGDETYPVLLGQIAGILPPPENSNQWPHVPDALHGGYPSSYTHATPWKYAQQAASANRKIQASITSATQHTYRSIPNG